MYGYCRIYLLDLVVWIFPNKEICILYILFMSVDISGGKQLNSQMITMHRSLLLYYHLNMRHLPIERLDVLAKQSNFWLQGTKIRIECLRSESGIQEEYYNRRI
jgi:hypothetical protein